MMALTKVLIRVLVKSAATKNGLLALAVVGLLGGGVMQVSAMGVGAERSQKKTKEEIKYPNATRTETTGKHTSKLQSKLQKLIDAYNKDEFEKTRVLVDELLASPVATDYDKGVINQIASQAAYNLDDLPATQTYLKQALAANTLSNNNHYALMMMLSQLYLQEDKFTEGLTLLDQYFKETKSTSADDLALKGQGLYQAERYAEAIEPLKQAIAAAKEPKDNWTQILMACYAETDQNTEALKLAEQIAAKAGGDKRAQMNLAAMYMQADQMDKSVAVLEKIRASGQMTEDKEYRQLYIAHANMDNHEKDVISVINQGMEKGILKPDQQTYLALAQSYYYSEQIPPAIEAWKKAAPLSKDGETYLNLARVLFQENRLPEAKAAAQSALEKGIKNPADAKKILAQK